MLLNGKFLRLNGGVKNFAVKNFRKKFKGLENEVKKSITTNDRHHRRV